MSFRECLGVAFDSVWQITHGVECLTFTDESSDFLAIRAPDFLIAIEGSKAEKSLKDGLADAGYNVILHKKDLIEGNFEIDLFLPELNTIIEIDGPQHFVPVFGEEKLQNTIKFDSIKNGLLISKGYCIIRIKYMCKHMSQSVERKLLKLVVGEVTKIEKKFPSKHKRLIELEINND